MANVKKGAKQIYTIGLAAYRIGINYTNNLDFLGIIEPELKAFSRSVGKTVFFGVRSDHDVVYICKFEPAESHHHHSHCWDQKSHVLHVPGKGHTGVHR